MKKEGGKIVIYAKEDDDQEDQPTSHTTKAWKKDLKDLRVVEISQGNYADTVHQQCYLSDTPHVIQAHKGYMEDYPEHFYTSHGNSAELRDIT